MLTYVRTLRPGSYAVATNQPKILAPKNFFFARLVLAARERLAMAEIRFRTWISARPRALIFNVNTWVWAGAMAFPDKRNILAPSR